MSSDRLKDYSITVLQKRLLAIVIAVTFLFVFVLGRLFFVQVIWGEELQEKAIDQWTREIPVVAKRGKITDTNGVVLAGNKDTYTVFVRKSAVSDREKLISALSESLSIGREYVEDRLTKTNSSEITIKKQVEKEQIDKLLSYGLNGIYYSRDNYRVYPYGELLTSVLGFTSADGKGQSGLELYYDKYLSGINGEILYETDIVGKEVNGGKATYTPAISGLNLKLTVDYDVQRSVETAMKEAYEIHKAKSCQMLVLDAKSGAVRAMSVYPSFDLNAPPREDLGLLYALARNRLVSDVYEPGSTFKILTAAADLEEYYSGNKKAYSPDHVFSSARYRYIDGQKIKCWSNHEHGKHANLNLSGALNNSCNPIFVDIAMSLGKETMYKYINAFGYGSVTGIDFSGEAQGMVLPVSSVLNVDLARIAFGQTIAVTGLQLACATMSAVNGGNYYVPYLVEEIYTDDGFIAEKITPRLKNKTISKKASETLALLLEDVVKNGSGKYAYIDGFRVGGKTGTAQKYENGVIASGKYVSSFVGFFPANDPKYVALVIIDEPEGQYYGSTVASPYFKSVFENVIKIKGWTPENVNS